MERTVAPYGSWRSPISAEVASSAAVGLGGTAIDGDDVYWIEMRPYEKGRSVIVRRAPDGTVADMTPPEMNVRTRVHEYGGGHYTVVDEVIYFANNADQRVHRQPVGGRPEPITPGGAGLRFADFRVDARRNRLVCVREDHSGGGEAVNTIVAIDLETGGPGIVLASGYDFYSSPRLDPSGEHLAWLSWRHPNMPWDGTELWVAGIGEDGSLLDARLVAGGPSESVFQPEWSPAGVLHFVSDRTGWWNLYRLIDGQVVALYPVEAEFGQPQWVFGMTLYGFLDADRILCSYKRGGQSSAGLLDASRGSMRELATPFTDIGRLSAGSGFAVVLGGSPARGWSVARMDLAPPGVNVTVLATTEMNVDSAYISVPEFISFPTTGGQAAYAYYYRPRNPSFAAPPDELPPLLVMSHGGPTGGTSAVLDPEIQFWTSRGFAVLDVDYRGSTGYGRAYRELLNGQWGVADLEDCANGAQHLVERGEVDGKRLAIRGGSAGGYTTLCALTFTNVFSAGASYYGVSDLGGLAEDMHKFESRYLESIVGPYDQSRDVYHARSPVNHCERLSTPLILFQGLDDPVVPPAQSEKIYAALRANGVPVAYLPFEGEQHGFRQAKNLIRSLEAELYFYGRVLGFEPADEIEPVQIENLA